MTGQEKGDFSIQVTA